MITVRQVPMKRPSEKICLVLEFGVGWVRVLRPLVSELWAFSKTQVSLAQPPAWSDQIQGFLLELSVASVPEMLQMTRLESLANL